MNLDAVPLDKSLGSDAAGQRRDMTNERPFRAHLDAHGADGGIDRRARGDRRQNVDDIDLHRIGRAVTHRDGAEREDSRSLALTGDQHGKVRIDLIGADDAEAHLWSAGLGKHASAACVKRRDGNEYGRAFGDRSHATLFDDASLEAVDLDWSLDVDRGRSSHTTRHCDTVEERNRGRLSRSFGSECNLIGRRGLERPPCEASASDEQNESQGDAQEQTTTRRTP